jgi:hypothetical protein
MAVLQIRRPEPSMPILKDCSEWESHRADALQANVRIRLNCGKMREVGGAVMPAEIPGRTPPERGWAPCFEQFDAKTGDSVAQCPSIGVAQAASIEIRSGSAETGVTA